MVFFFKPLPHWKRDQDVKLTPRRHMKHIDHNHQLLEIRQAKHILKQILIIISYIFQLHQNKLKYFISD